jgi:NADPH:quinone reductase-like Zn-dependent oxidoreductase
MSDPAPKMMAVLQHRYGAPDQVLSVGQVARPSPGPNQVLVRVQAASVHPDIWHTCTGRPWVMRVMGGGFRRPKNAVPGTDMAGIVHALGPGVHTLRVGDRVFGDVSGDMQWKNCATFAEFAVAAETALQLMPADVAFEEAAAVATSGRIAVQALRDQGAVSEGQRVLINGAGGGVGSVCVALAKAMGAYVIGVDSGAKLGFVRLLGADEILDFRSADYTQVIDPVDLVVDVPGNRSWRDIRRVVKPSGRYVLVGHDGFGKRAGIVMGSIRRFVGLMLRSYWDDRLRPNRITPSTTDRLKVLAGRMEASSWPSLVGHALPLTSIREAMSLLVNEGNVGKIVLRPSGP